MSRRILIKDLILKGKFDVMFDCTGGRLNPPIFTDSTDKWMEKININPTKYPKLDVNIEKNVVNLNIKTDRNHLIF